MRNGMREQEHGFALVGRPTVFDVGIGVLYFFASHMVIRTMYYVGVDRSLAELSTFFLIVVCAVALAHLLAKPLLRARLFIESSFGVPAVSMVAAVGAALALVSMLPVVGVGLFWASGALLGLACGWMTVIWTSTIRASHPDPDSFFIDPSLAVAVAVYFLFRLVSTFSDAVAQGFLLALPLAALACIVRAGRDEDGAAIVGERAQALQVLVVVAAVFAVGCSVVAFLSGREDGVLSSGLNYMVLFEALAVLTVMFCSGSMGRFAWEGSALGARGTAALTLCVCVVPLFCIGLVMGGAGIPDRSPDALWETSVWVLIVAIFAYDIRTSPYAVKGLAVGVMFEAMCVGQLVVRASTLGGGGCPFSPCLGVGLTLLYFASVCRHVLDGPRVEGGLEERRDRAGAGRDERGGTGEMRPSALRAGAEAMRASGAVGETAKGAALKSADTSGMAVGKGASAGALDERVRGEAYAEARGEADAQTRGETDAEVAAGSGGSERPGALQEDGVPAEILACCQKLALENGLTRREAEILGLIAMGRSAKYIADELLISYNTTRTHIRHVYEKLNIHAKQELIDLVLFGSGIR